MPTDNWLFRTWPDAFCKPSTKQPSRINPLLVIIFPLVAADPRSSTGANNQPNTNDASTAGVPISATSSGAQQETVNMNDDEVKALRKELAETKGKIAR